MDRSDHNTGAGVEDAAAETQRAVTATASDGIPLQYRDLPSDLVEELWTPAESVDPQRRAETREQRATAIEALKQEEITREARKEESFRQQYARLAPEQRRRDFPIAQDAATLRLRELIQGPGDASEELPREEWHVLQKLRAQYREFKAEHPNEPFAFEFAQEIDRKTYANIFQRLAFAELHGARAREDQRTLEAVRSSLGIAPEAQPLQSTPTPEIPTTENPFAKFRLKQGETAPGVHWNEYESVAALDERGKRTFEWGKERIYMDVPVVDLVKLRDLAFRAAADAGVAVAFKHLDAQRSAEWAQHDGTTRFVANFASVADAKRFYTALAKLPEYRALRPDRALDYHAHQLDEVAHYASGFRERRSTLENIVRNARENPDGTFTYPAVGDGRSITIERQYYDSFVREYQSLPDPASAWEQA